MITLDCKNEILIRFYKLGYSKREISQGLGVSRKTVSRYVSCNQSILASSEINHNIKKVLSIAPKYLVAKRRKTKLTKEIQEFIDENLLRKQHCNQLKNRKDIYKAILRKGYDISYTTVCNYVRSFNKNEYIGVCNSNLSNTKKINWIYSLSRGVFNFNYLQEIYSTRIPEIDIFNFNKWIKKGDSKKRDKAISIFCHFNDYSTREISYFLLKSRKTIDKYIKIYKQFGLHGLTKKSEKKRKHEDQSIIKELFKIFHSSPISYNINRTTWVQNDLKEIFEKETGINISKACIQKIISNAGYKIKKAKKVLTSNDPNYKDKVLKINRILSTLKTDEKFFSIDEYGPFAIKIQGGRDYVKNGEIRTYPQWQKSKGSLIITAALELSTNQVTHFYSDKKNTMEMIKLLDTLLIKYSNDRRIYFSWDAASWHASKKLNERVTQINNTKYCPMVELAPLPNCAQFLNVIESVFSGMARAIIHNSNYKSVDDCKISINRYFAERNEHFLNEPKRAGNKIWKLERVLPIFDESNNCKDNLYGR